MEKNNEHHSTNPSEKSLLFKGIKSFFCSKILFAIIFILLGIVGTLLVQIAFENRFSSRKHLSYLTREDNLRGKNMLVFHNDSFLEEEDIFEEMEELIEKRINDTLRRHRKQIKQAFEKARKNSPQDYQASVTTREDQDSYYYELDFAGLTKEDITVEIKDNILTFLGNSNKEDNDKNHLLRSSSNFRYSFYVPNYDLSQPPELSKQDNKITVKLRKLSKN